MSQRPIDGVRASNDPLTSAADTPTAADELRAALSDRFTLEEEIGRGAAGVVYKALDRTSGSTVAIKVLRDEFAVAVSVARFAQEIELGRTLKHPRIIPVFESGLAAQRPYYTMPFVAGKSLREQLAIERQMPIGDVFTIAGQVADALDHAHQHGVVHRDVKPGNILLGDDGAVVADFGIARAVTIASGERLSDSGIALGTPEYMSPEQAEGSRAITGRSDVYGLGCVVYEMLSGEPPFTGPNAQAIVARHFREAPRSIRIVRPAVPAQAEAAIEKALAKVPADRFATAGEFVAALTGPDVVGPRTVAERRARNVGRGVLTLALAMAGVLAIAALQRPTRVAARAYARGHAAIDAGDFARADTEFFAATRADPTMPQPLVWLALVRWWMNAPVDTWSQLAEQAAGANAPRNALSASESLHLAALRSLATKQGASACDAWGRATTLAPHEYAGWYSLGICMRRDRGVTPSSSSPTGWTFVTSYEQALRAYEQAFRLRPALLHGLGARALGDLQELFVISSSRTRGGTALRPDTGLFNSYASWDHDTLVYFPAPRAAALLGAPPEQVALAIRKQRERLFALARLWRAEFPRRADAAEAVAVSLEMLGDSTALDTLRLARALATAPSEGLRMAAAEVLLRVKYAVPGRIDALRAAAKSADSLFAAHPASARMQPGILGSLAALLGHAHLAASYAAIGGLGTVPSAVAQSGPQLLAFASLGGPTDSLHALEQRAAMDISSLPEPDRTVNRARWITRAASLAYPDFSMTVLRDPPSASSAGSAVSAAAATGNRAALDAILASLTRARLPMRPADVMIDGLFTEAAALSELGDYRRAAAWLDPSLESVRLWAASDLGQLPRAATLVRAMALRANLAARMGDTATARRWAGAVATLWADADAFLQPTVTRMKFLAR